MLTPERVVLLLTPILAGLSGWLVQLIAQHFPGTPHLDEVELTAIFAAGVLAAVTAVWQWAKGRMAQNADRRMLEMTQQTLPPEDPMPPIQGE